MPRTQVPSLFEVPPEQLVEVKTLMFDGLVRRDIAESDASQAVEDVLVRIARRPEQYAPQLTSLHLYRQYFLDAALDAHLLRLQRERWRRRRERGSATTGGAAFRPGRRRLSA